ncbi:hypothetical protein J6590_051718 [Homalodisca vitripennis]|nr:hypothetical protein J6590_051718 [Homalodisca vitripennis]
MTQKTQHSPDIQHFSPVSLPERKSSKRDVQGCWAVVEASFFSRYFNKRFRIKWFRTAERRQQPTVSKPAIIVQVTPFYCPIISGVTRHFHRVLYRLSLTRLRNNFTLHSYVPLSLAERTPLADSAIGRKAGTSLVCPVRTFSLLETEPVAAPRLHAGITFQWNTLGHHRSLMYKLSHNLRPGHWDRSLSNTAISTRLDKYNTLEPQMWPTIEEVWSCTTVCLWATLWMSRSGTLLTANVKIDSLVLQEMTVGVEADTELASPSFKDTTEINAQSPSSWITTGGGPYLINPEHPIIPDTAQRENSVAVMKPGGKRVDASTVRRGNQLCGVWVMAGPTTVIGLLIGGSLFSELVRFMSYADYFHFHSTWFHAVQPFTVHVCIYTIDTNETSKILGSLSVGGGTSVSAEEMLD